MRTGNIFARLQTSWYTNMPPSPHIFINSPHPSYKQNISPDPKLNECFVVPVC